MPDRQDVVRRITKGAKSLARRGLEKAPRVARVARSTYFAVLNSRTVQQLAYRDWLRAHVHASPAVDGTLRSPRISIVLDVAGQPPDAAQRAVDRVLAQTYRTWDLTVVSDAQPSLDLGPDHRLLVTPGSTFAFRVTAAMADLEGEYVVVVEPDDVLYPDSLAALAAVATRSSDAGLVHGGHDVCRLSVDRHGVERLARTDPFFSPAWNPELLHSTPYLGLTLFRTSLVVAAGGLRDLPGGELWDLELRLTGGRATVAHTDGIVAGRLAGARPVPDATATQVLRSALAVEGTPEATIAQGRLHGTWSIRYPVTGEPLVSIVIPSKNAYDVVRRCVESIYATTSYTSFEVVLVDTGSDEEEVLRWYEDVARRHSSFRVVEWPEQPFSYARSCNAGAAAARGEVLVMLNNDTEVLEPSWLDVLVGEAQRPEVGIVGCLLLYPDRRTVQHAGIGLGIKTVAGNSLAGLRLDRPLLRTQELLLWTRRATTAVTAACVAVRKATYDEVGGFDPLLRITFNDVDLCLRVGALGYRNVYTPDVRLLHHESKTIAPSRDWTELFAAADLFRSRWSDVVAHDPQLNPNLARTTTSYRLPFHGL
ncbi:MAG TPA: glycosyltransferase family 2 protein [Propionibacteriaceae bacterium]|nr:glycosyltransferase family 2 protein [Propionibacteriaceae bacterium]